MDLTLREALQIGPLSHARVVAGHGGLDQIVKSVTIMEAPDILDWAHAGDFLVTTSYPLLDRTISETEFVQNLKDKGIVGLAAKLYAFLKEYASAMIESANALDHQAPQYPGRLWRTLPSTTHTMSRIINKNQRGMGNYD